MDWEIDGIFNPDEVVGASVLVIFLKIKLIINQDVISTQISNPLMFGESANCYTDTLRLLVTVQLW